MSIHVHRERVRIQIARSPVAPRCSHSCIQSTTQVQLGPAVPAIDSLEAQAMNPYHDSSDAEGEADPEYAVGGGVLDPSLGVSVSVFRSGSWFLVRGQVPCGNAGNRDDCYVSRWSG